MGVFQEIVGAARFLFADHVQMALQHHRRTGLLSGGGRFADIHIVVRILLCGQTSLFGPLYQISGNRRLVPGAARDPGDLLKELKNFCRL